MAGAIWWALVMNGAELAATILVGDCCLLGRSHFALAEVQLSTRPEGRSLSWWGSRPSTKVIASHAERAEVFPMPPAAAIEPHLESLEDWRCLIKEIHVVSATALVITLLASGPGGDSRQESLGAFRSLYLDRDVIGFRIRGLQLPCRS